MSRTEYHHGTLRNTGLSVLEYVSALPSRKQPDLNELSYYESLEDWFREEFYGKALIMEGFVWEAEDHEADAEAGIFKADLQEDGSYEYVLQYYNGGCSWEEALLVALGKE